jgi:hypothetical protein
MDTVLDASCVEQSLLKVYPPMMMPEKQQQQEPDVAPLERGMSVDGDIYVVKGKNIFIEDTETSKSSFVIDLIHGAYYVTKLVKSSRNYWHAEDYKRDETGNFIPLSREDEKLLYDYFKKMDEEAAKADPSSPRSPFDEFVISHFSEAAEKPEKGKPRKKNRSLRLIS